MSILPCMRRIHPRARLSGAQLGALILCSSTVSVTASATLVGLTLAGAR